MIVMEKFEYFEDFKLEEFKNIFTEYYLGEGIYLSKDTKVFDEIENSSKTQGTKCLVCKIENKIVGFILFRIVKLYDSKKFFKYSFGYIEELYVKKEHRNKHISTKLIDTFENYLKQNNVNVAMLTAEKNVYNFYINKGFKEEKSMFCANNLKCFIKNL